MVADPGITPFSGYVPVGGQTELRKSRNSPLVVLVIRALAEIPPVEVSVSIRPLRGRKLV
jgi:hypothetical protein